MSWNIRAVILRMSYYLMRCFTMKNVIKNIKNIVWLCGPYWKYGKLYFILSITISVFLAPVKDVIYVFFPKEVVDLLVNGKSFQYVAIYASIICGIAFITYLIPCLFFCYFQRKGIYIELKMKRDIYEKALHIDYKYIDNPEYYNKYAWALNEYADQANAACDFIKNFLQYFDRRDIEMPIGILTNVAVTLFEG